MGRMNLIYEKYLMKYEISIKKEWFATLDQNNKKMR
jgi:hypothetical protein